MADNTVINYKETTPCIHLQMEACPSRAKMHTLCKGSCAFAGGCGAILGGRASPDGATLTGLAYSQHSAGRPVHRDKKGAAPLCFPWPGSMRPRRVCLCNTSIGGIKIPPNNLSLSLSLPPPPPPLSLSPSLLP